MKKITNYILFFILFINLILVSCNNNDDTPAELSPTISNIEVGLHNSEIGVVGDDFHFNAEVLAGTLLEAVQINIVQKNQEEYESPWSFEIVFTERITGLKNAQLHRHFDIPAEAPVGNYDFIITVKDENGTNIEEVRDIKLIDLSDYPDIFPHVKVFGIDKIDVDGNGGFVNFYNNDEFRNPEDPSFSKGESIWASAQIGNIKDDGIMYGLLIKKSLNHKPERIEDIDFSKVIVTEVIEHSGFEEVRSFSNSYNKNYNNHYLYGAVLKIGATKDNNLPYPISISGDKAWENGTYYYGFVYTNTTYNMSTFRYIEFEIKGI